MNLTGLTAATTYHYQVLSRDAQGMPRLPRTSTCTTGAPPVVTGVNATSVTATSATINWSTDKAADSQVAYRTTAAYGATSALASTLTTAHAVGLTGLTAATTYHYQVLSRDAQGNLTTSADFTFTTGAPPVVTGVNATSVTATSATINWSTDKAADSQVAYGTTAAYGTTSALASTLTTAHAVNLTGLTAATTYHYQVLSKDAQGESTTSADFTFTTGAPPVVTG